MPGLLQWIVIAITLAEVQGQGPKDQDGIDQIAARRTTTFQYKGRVALQCDVAHLATSTSLVTPIVDFNKLVDALDASEHRAHSLVRSRAKGGKESVVPCGGGSCTYPMAYGLLRRQLSDIRETLAFFCQETNCPWTVKTLVNHHTGSLVGPSPTHVIQKRQLGIILAGVGVGLSLYTLYEVESLKGEIFDIKTNQNVMHHEIAGNRHAINSNRELISKIVDRLDHEGDWMHSVSHRLAVDELQFLLKMYADTLAVWLGGLEDILLRQSFSPKMFTTGAVSDSVRALQMKAAKNGFELSFSDLNDLARAPLSYVVVKNCIFVFIHIPVVTKTRLNLYALIDAPMRSQHGKTVRVQTDNKFLAINDNNDEFIEMNAAEMTSCVKYAGIYVCPIGRISKNARAGCLSALFLSDKEAHSVCNFLVTKESMESVTQVSPTEAIVTAPTGISDVTVFLNCHDGLLSRTSSLTVHEARRIKVPANCLLSTDNFSFRPTLRGGYVAAFVMREVPHQDLENIVYRIDAAERHRKTEFTRFNVTASDLELLPPISPLEYHHKHSSFVHTILSSAMAIAIIAGVLLLAYCTCKVQRRRAKKKRRQKKMDNMVEMATLKAHLGDVENAA